jgi:N6-adenosine-specific RNA methylase IME4
MDKRFQNLLTDQLLNAKGFYEYGLDKNLITEKSFRYTIAERQKQVKLLAESGSSTRKIAKVVGVSQAQVRRDLRPKGQKSEPKRLTKAEKRAEREAELAAKQIALPVKRYGVIVADPEWRFEPYSRDTGMDRAADNHYPTSNTETIAARPVEQIADDDCVLFLWATVPMLPDAVRVMMQWGFTYQSHMIWDKVHIGTGYWVRNRHELLLIGTRGNVPAPAPGDQFPSVLAIARKEHSAKPEQFLEMIEQYFPTLPKIELNRRGPPRRGWDAWGNEAEAA